MNSTGCTWGGCLLVDFGVVDADRGLVNVERPGPEARGGTWGPGSVLNIERRARLEVGARSLVPSPRRAEPVRAVGVQRIVDR